MVNGIDEEVQGENSTPDWLQKDSPVKITTIAHRRNSTDYSNKIAAKNNRPGTISNADGDNGRSGGGKITEPAP